jgi:hypothetical protein
MVTRFFYIKITESVIIFFVQAIAFLNKYFYFYYVNQSHGRAMEKIHFPSDREYDARPFKTLFFQDEFNSETPIVDDYIEPFYDDPVSDDDEEELL